MNILIYYPYNTRSVEQQSIMEMLIGRGHKVTLLTTCEKSYLHEYVERIGIATEHSEVSVGGKLNRYIAHAKILYRTLRKYNIEVVIAHQQIPALIAGIVNKFRKFKLIYVRHNSDEDYHNNRIKAWLLNRLVNRISPIKIAPSSIVKRFWIEREGVQSSEIYRLNYGYNFQLYEKPDIQEATRIRDFYSADLLVLSIARLVHTKRHKDMFDVIDKLVLDGIDVKMICLGEGPLHEELTHRIQKMRLEDRIFLLGRQANVLDYIQSADVFLHLSSAEASNSAVKEVGLCSKPVIVCSDVGDFSDYIVSGLNGFLVSKSNPVEEAYMILQSIYKGDEDKIKIGVNLEKTVIETFSIGKVMWKYDQLLRDV